MAQAIMADSSSPRSVVSRFRFTGWLPCWRLPSAPRSGGGITDSYSWHWIFYINIPVGILAFFLTNRLVEDPPFEKPDRENLYRIDYIGVGLLVIAMGALQITWTRARKRTGRIELYRRFCLGFHHFVHRLDLVGVSYRKAADGPAPIEFRNFAVCAFLMLLTGGLLNATTVLQPQFLQQELGYTAISAGFRSRAEDWPCSW